MRTVDQIIQGMEETKSQGEFLPTGFWALDRDLDGGFMRKELIVLGGYTGMGKSYIATQIAWQILIKGFKTAYFSLEISDEMVVSRIVGHLANVKPTRVIYGLLLPEEKERIDKAKLEIITYGELFEVYDNLYQLTEIGEAVIAGKYDFVVIDFIQNIFHKGEEYERLSYISLYLQKLAKKTNSCILVLSQLSNSAAKAGLMEYKGSGAIAMVSDLGFFLKRSEANGNMNDIELSLKKNRRGFSGTNYILEFQQPGGRISQKNNL